MRRSANTKRTGNTRRHRPARQRAGRGTPYITHDAWISLTATDLTYPNGRQVTSGYDLLYRRNTISETSGAASIAQWGFTGDRVVECLLGNGLICTQLNNARTNSMVQSPDVPNPAWGDISSDRLGYDGSGRMICKRFLAGGIDGDSGAYNDPTSVVGFTTFYDPSGNKLYERALHAESRSTIYSNDLLNRFLQYQRGTLVAGGASIGAAITLPGTDSQRSYDLDGMGNWKNTTYTPVGASQTTEVRRHNLLNQLTKFGSTPVTYDNGNNRSSSNPIIFARGNGNIYRDGTNQYEYDALNRIHDVNRLSDLLQTALYSYDALGRRVTKIVFNGGLSGTITNATYRYLYDGNQIIEELLVGETITTLRQFVWGQYIDELVQLMTYGDTGTQPLAAGSYYPLQDLLYRTAALTDSGGNIVEAYDYDAYGNTLMFSIAGSGGTDWWADDCRTTLQPSCEYLFTGRQYDPETEVYWYRARYYIPLLGRFFNRDHIDDYDHSNMYGYVTSAPGAYIDPFGLLQTTPLIAAAPTPTTLPAPHPSTGPAPQTIGSGPTTKPESSCCCCADSIKIVPGILRIGKDRATGKPIAMSNRLLTTVQLTYTAMPGVTNPTSLRDCTLKWLEKTNIPAFAGVPANQWTDMTKVPATKNSFLDSWGIRQKKCGTAEPVIDADYPYLLLNDPATGMPRTTTRGLSIQVIVESGEGCGPKDGGPCKNDSVKDTAIQQLDVANGVPNPGGSYIFAPNVFQIPWFH